MPDAGCEIASGNGSGSIGRLMVVIVGDKNLYSLTG
jgi:hypothetical protein